MMFTTEDLRVCMSEATEADLNQICQMVFEDDWPKYCDAQTQTDAIGEFICRLWRAFLNSAFRRRIRVRGIGRSRLVNTNLDRERRLKLDSRRVTVWIRHRRRYCCHSSRLCYRALDFSPTVLPTLSFFVPKFNPRPMSVI